MRSAVLAGCSVSALATAAHAQTAEAGTRIEEVVVTALRTAQNIQSVPVAVTALDSAALEKRSISDVQDIQLSVPNMQIREESAVVGMTIGIRGINVPADNFAFDSAVGVYVNDVFIARSNDFGATFFDVDSVQVLRGPQGTLFGRNTPAGAVLIDTKGPGATYGGYAQVGLGGGGHLGGDGADRSIFRLEGAVDLPIAENFGVRLAGYKLNDTGYGRSRTTGYEFARRDNYGVRATFEARPTERFSARLILDQSRLDQGVPLNVPLEYLVPRAAQPWDRVNGGTAQQDLILAMTQNITPYLSNSWFTTQRLVGRSNSATLNLKYSLSDNWGVRSISGWRKIYRDTQNDNYGTPFGDLVKNDTATTATIRQQQISQEFVVNGDITERFHVLAGLYYFREKGSDQNIIKANVLTVPAPAHYDPLILRGQGIVYTSKAVFANLSYDILPTLTASVGYRFAEEKKHVDLNSSFKLSGTVFARGPEDFNDKVPLYDAKLTWKATPDLLFYGKYGTGYRAGGIGFRAADAQFMPETVKTSEAGAKWDFNVGAMPARLNTAVFHSKYENFQVSVNLTNPTRSTVVNAGSATLKGAELEFSVKPVPALDVSASLGLLDAHYNQFLLNNSSFGPISDFSGNKLREAPDVTFSASAGYTIPSSIGEWLLQLDYAYSADYFVDTLYQPTAPALARTNVFHQKATNIWNTRIKLGQAFGSKVDVSLWGKNITDQKILTYGLAVGTLRNGTYGEPMSYGIDLRAAF